MRTAQGPVFSNVVCQTAVEGTPQIQQEMILYRGLKRVDFVNHIEKQVNYKPEMIYYAFPLDLHKPQFTLGLPGATAKIEQDLMNCANRNWFAVEHWVDVRSDQSGATWATVEAPLVCLGGISRRWVPHIPGDQGWLFSLVMDNIWGTNFRAGQGGKADVPLCFDQQRRVFRSCRGLPLRRRGLKPVGMRLSRPAWRRKTAGRRGMLLLRPTRQRDGPGYQRRGRRTRNHRSP